MYLLFIFYYKNLYTIVVLMRMVMLMLMNVVLLLVGGVNGVGSGEGGGDGGEVDVKEEGWLVKFGLAGKKYPHGDV